MSSYLLAADVVVFTQAVPKAVLLLVVPLPTAQQRLRQQAAAAGVDPTRLFLPPR